MLCYVCKVTEVVQHIILQQLPPAEVVLAAAQGDTLTQDIETAKHLLHEQHRVELVVQDADMMPQLIEVLAHVHGPLVAGDKRSE